MMKRLAVLLGAILVLGACEDHEGFSSIITGPQNASFAGTWTGEYTSSNNPGSVFTATLQLAQNGTSVSGTRISGSYSSNDCLGLTSGSARNSSPAPLVAFT